jgi:hypothetical protein
MKIMRSLVARLSLLLTIANSAAFAQNNILNNGGFETGTMCYAHWIWGKEDWAGDYKFGLSTDAHSGEYSAEIACRGSDCNKAAIFSDKMPVHPGQTYMLSAYAKCPGRTHSFMHVPGTTEGDVSVDLKCDNKWNLAKLIFTTSANANYAFYYFFNADKSWLRVDDVLLTFAHGIAPQYQPLDAGQRDVKIAGQNVLVDGAPFLSLGFFDVGYNDLGRVAESGANTINGGVGEHSAADCFNTGQKSYLDQIYELGMNFIPGSSTAARLETPAIFSTIAKTFAPHLANIGWFLSDEPDHPKVKWLQVSPSTLVAEHNSLKSATALPDMSDFQMGAYGSVGDIAPYVDASDIWMAEPYGTNFATVNHAVNLFNSIRIKPIWLAQDDIDAPLIVPKAYWAIIAGVTGIHYFTWQIFKKDPAKLAAAQQVFGELRQLKNAIFGDSLDALVTAPAGIASMSRFDAAANTGYILSANGRAENINGTFAVEGLEAGQTIRVLNENRSIVAGAGSFSDTFAGISRHVYAIDCKATSGAGAHWDFCHR